MKPCPFCGTECDGLRVKPGYQVECRNCGAEGPVAPFATAAVQEWDRRIVAEKP